MNRDGNLQVTGPGKILRLPLFRPRRAATPLDAKVSEAHVLQSRRRRAIAWVSGAWALLAWTVAACELRLPVMHHEVFGVETMMAFLVVVSMPLVHAGRIANAARQAVVGLRRATTGRRGAEPKGAEAHPTAFPGSRPSHLL